MDSDFEEVPTIALFASKELVDMWERLGRPDSPLTESGSKMMNVIIAAWEELYPKEAKDWHEARKEYRTNELNITEQVHKHTGRSLASYPFPIYQMMKRIFTGFKPGDRESCIKLVNKFPMFKMANRV